MGELLNLTRPSEAARLMVNELNRQREDKGVKELKSVRVGSELAIGSVKLLHKKVAGAVRMNLLQPIDDEAAELGRATCNDGFVMRLLLDVDDRKLILYHITTSLDIVNKAGNAVRLPKALGDWKGFNEEMERIRDETCRILFGVIPELPDYLGYALPLYSTISVYPEDAELYNPA